MVKRLIVEANRLYYRSEAGIGALPRGSRPGIYAARFIYAGIGGRLTAMGYDSITTRARTSKPQKLGWLAQSMMLSGLSMVTPRSPVVFAPALPEVQFLVDAAATGAQAPRSDSLFDALAALEARRREERAALIGARARVT